MSSTNQEITALRTEVTNLASRLLSVTPNQIVPVVVGEFILFGCKVTEGVLDTDFVVSLEGQASGDSANLNPKLSATPSRGFEFPNIASTIGGMLATNDLTATVGAAPATGTARYDIAFVFAGKEGAGFNIQPGSPAVAVKDDFDTYGLDASPFGQATITDPDLPIGALAVARIYVEDVFTGIQDARIADIRDFTSTLVGNSFAIPPVLGSTTPNAIKGTTGDFSDVLNADQGVTFGGGSDVFGGFVNDTYVPTLTASTSGTITLDASEDDLVFFEFDDYVWVQGRIRVDSVSSPLGDLRLSLPATASGAPAQSARTTSSVLYTAINAIGTAGALQISIAANGVFASIVELTTTSFITDVANHMIAGSRLQFGFGYKKA